ncbi:DUF3105 domain-containing protein [Halomicrobium urmianum]|uniref:DUF3105 domain-containing protein n=1 Tax=Halomicrobium urmianum TaxID=1586233 RepID=UPI001CDA0CC6|nr:DUF3105 domain-containing protein [Halomicrobium urmianum]
MPSCDKCDASFESEDDYRLHRREAHGEDVGPIEGPPRENRLGSRVPGSTRSLAFGVVFLLSVAVTIYVTMFMGQGGANQVALPEHGNDTIVSQVQTEQATSIEHVPEDADVNYSTVPPTGGRHYSSTVSAGVYSDPQSYGALVHSLEHGAVVVYYDPSQLSADERENLESYANAYQDPWQSFIAVPNPQADPDAAYVLTAWEKRLTMDEYDPATVRAFTAEYLGRGPENPVR